MLFSRTPKRDYFTPTNTHKPWFKERQATARPRNRTLLILVSLLCFLLGVVVSPLSRAESGELMLQNEDGEATPALLHATHVELHVNGMIAHVTYSQEFTNNSQEWKHAVYTFPFNENAAINSMEMRIGDRIIRGQLKAKPDAEKVFNAAKKAGKKASLTEQQRPNLFTQHLANIAPGEQITVTLQYIQQVTYENGEFSFHLPTTLTPRYIPGIPLKNLNDTALEERAYSRVANNADTKTVTASEKTGHTAAVTGWAFPTNEVVDADKITPLMLDTWRNTPTNNNKLFFSATLKAGMALKSIVSKSHQLNWQSVENSKYQYSVSLEGDYTTMDRDLWISWQPQQSMTPHAGYFSENFGGDHYALVMLTPPQVNPKDLQDFPREVTFVIDTSGSMAGRPIEDAKSALKLAIKRLDAKDRFNVIAFNSGFTKLFAQPTNTQAHNINTAMYFIAGLNANGGTEMAGALAEALATTPDENHIKQVVFITDGAVGNEPALFSLIEKELNTARLFTVGIGSAPNSYFMTRAAQFGRGSYVFINNSNNIQTEMQRLFTKLESPVLSNLTLTLPDSVQHIENIETYPKRLPDLYAGEPLLINLKIPHVIEIENRATSADEKGELNHNVVLSGVLNDKDGNVHKWQRSIQAVFTGQDSGQGQEQAQLTEKDSVQSSGIATAWARKKVAALMDQKALGRNEEDVIRDILNVALSHKLITAYTSFAAVEQSVSKPQSADASLEHLKNVMPDGTQMRAVSFPQTSAGIHLLLVFGSTALLLLLLMYAGKAELLVTYLLKNERQRGTRPLSSSKPAVHWGKPE
ncbi:marine proteobacterial sortase target protein [Alteromonas gracilis]|uniref:marine proteobacterial sortase target protein n=1 Tax=Alteromonas gracilis TaxID=1479524 RepID=UPI003735FD64